MKRLVATLILVVFALGGLFHGSHVHMFYAQARDLPTNQSYLSDYPKMPEAAGYPVVSIPF